MVQWIGRNDRELLAWHNTVVSDGHAVHDLSDATHAASGSSPPSSLPTSKQWLRGKGSAITTDNRFAEAAFPITRSGAYFLTCSQVWYTPRQRARLQH